MKEPKLVEIKKYLNAIVKMNKKYVTAERLSKVVGIYPEIINEQLSFFEPTLMMDPEFNLMELVPALKKFVVEKEEERSSILIKKPAIKKQTLQQYDSVSDFIYKRMTLVGGLLDRNVVLSDTDLRILKKLISEEQLNRKKAKERDK